MFSFLKRRRLGVLTPNLVEDLSPKMESSRRLVTICQTEDAPRALLEAGIVELFAVHQSVLAAQVGEEARQAILPRIHERFASDYRAISAQAGLSSGELLNLTARRLQTYASLFDRSLPDWHLRFAEQAFEAITGKRCESALCYALGIAILSIATETTKFVRKVLE